MVFFWGFFCMQNYFPPLPTQTLHGARACNSAGCFDSSRSESSVICSSESVQAKQREQCSNWQTCPDNTKARHRRVAGKIAWSNTSSEPQISLWKHFFPSLEVLWAKWLFVLKVLIFFPSSISRSPRRVVSVTIFSAYKVQWEPKRGNYAVSDPCMTVGFGLGVGSWKQDDRNQSQRFRFIMSLLRNSHQSTKLLVRWSPDLDPYSSHTIKKIHCNQEDGYMETVCTQVLNLGISIFGFFQCSTPLHCL